MESKAGKRRVFGVDEVKVEECDVLGIVKQTTARRASHLEC